MTDTTRWTKDNRYIVWTIGDMPDVYNLYVAGERVAHNLPFDEFWPIYNSYKDEQQQKKAA